MQWSKLLCPERIRTQQHKAKEDLRTEFEKDYQRIIGSASSDAFPRGVLLREIFRTKCGGKNFKRNQGPGFFAGE